MDRTISIALSTFEFAIEGAAAALPPVEAADPPVLLEDAAAEEELEGRCLEVGFAAAVAVTNKDMPSSPSSSAAAAEAVALLPRPMKPPSSAVLPPL